MDISNRQMKQAPAGKVGENQNRKADQLGNRGCGGGTGNSHIQSKDKDGVQNYIQNSAKAHSDHGQGRASLTAQTLVHYEVACHEGGGQKDIGGILNAVALTGRSSPQKAYHGGHKGNAKNHQGSSEKRGKEKSG